MSSAENLAGKVALVAGASRGIGAETARAFARSGAAVVLGARDADRSSFVTGAVIPVDGGQSAGTKPPRMYRQGQGMQPQPG